MRRWLTRARSRQDGYVMVAVILVSVVLMIMVLGVLSEATTEVKLARRSIEWEGAWYGALAGIEECVRFIQWGTESSPHDGMWLYGQSGTLSGCNLTGTVGDAAYEVSAEMTGTMTARVTSIGQVGPSRRKLHAIVKSKIDGGPGQYSFMAGGNVKFGGGGGGGGEVIGNLAAVEKLDIPSQLDICGELRAGELALAGSPNWMSSYNGEPCTPNTATVDNTLQFPDFDMTKFSQAAVEAKGWAWHEITDEKMPVCASSSDPGCDGTSQVQVWYSPGHIAAGSSTGCTGAPNGPNSTARLKGQVYFVAAKNVCLGRRIINEDFDPVTRMDNGGVVYFYTENNIFPKPGGNDMIGVMLVADPLDRTDTTKGNVDSPGQIKIWGAVFAWSWNNDGNIYLYNRPNAVYTDETVTTTGVDTIWESPVN